MKANAIMLVCVAVLGITGCAKVCASKIGVESKPGGARVYMRGDTDVSFSPVPKVAGGKQVTMTTPDNITFRWANVPHMHKIWVKVIWGDDESSQAESDPVELSKCENARLVFTKDQPPVKQPVEVVDDAAIQIPNGSTVSVLVLAEGCD